jgi:hypothetical protein
MSDTTGQQVQPTADQILEGRLSTEYGRLCQELGHLQSNIDKLEARVEDIKAQIRGIDLLSLPPRQRRN